MQRPHRVAVQNLIVHDPSMGSLHNLRGPGLRAYFWPAPKVGKNALRKRSFLRTFRHYGGYLFCARGMVWFFLLTVPSASFPFCVYFSVVIESPYRLAGPTPRGAKWGNEPSIGGSASVAPPGGSPCGSSRTPLLSKTGSGHGPFHRPCSPQAMPAPGSIRLFLP